LLWLLRDQGPGVAFRLALLYGVVYGLGTMYWFYGLFGFLANGLVGLFALYFGLLGALVALTRGWSPPARAAWAALFAVGVEWFRGDAWYLRFPWYTVPHALASEPAAIAAARWVGTYGLTALVWFIAAWGAFGRGWAWAGFILLPACGLLLPAVAEPDRRALVLQAEPTSRLGTLLPSAPSEGIDLAVLPEYAYFQPYQRVLESPAGPAALARKARVPVVFGAVAGDIESGDFENVAVVVDATGSLRGTFTKQRPVPLFRDGRAGTERPVFPLEQGTLGVAVCYDLDAPEVAGSLVAAGATVLVSPSYDASGWGWAEHVHHELLLRLRAVENDRWLVRAVSSGRSESISPWGVPSAEGVEIGAVGFAVVPYGHRDTRPPGSRTCVLGPTAAAGTFLFLVGWAAARWRGRREAGEKGAG
jgi:apolipoprotein N-acyltransferase